MPNLTNILLNGSGYGLGSGLSENQKGLLIEILRNGLYNTDQSDNIDELEQSFNKPVSSITAILNLGSDHIYSDDSLDVLRQYLTVVATFEDTTSEAVTAYQLSGTLTVGTSVITVTYRDKSATVSVPVNTPVTKYSITNNLTNVVNSNSAERISEGNTYNAVLSGSAYNFEVNSVTVTLGANDVTATAWDAQTGTVTIANVNGAIVITASAVRVYKPVSGAVVDYDFRNKELTYLNAPGWGNCYTLRDDSNSVYMLTTSNFAGSEHGFKGANWRAMREISDGSLTSTDFTMDTNFTISCLYYNDTEYQPSLCGWASNIVVAGRIECFAKYINGVEIVTNTDSKQGAFDRASGVPYTLVTYRANGGKFEMYYNDTLALEFNSSDYEGFARWSAGTPAPLTVYNTAYAVRLLAYDRALTDAELLANKDYFDSIK